MDLCNILDGFRGNYVAWKKVYIEGYILRNLFMWYSWNNLIIDGNRVVIFGVGGGGGMLWL